MIKNIRLILGLLLAMSSASWAATYVRNGANESWGTVAGWNDNSGGPFAASTVLPGASDNVTLTTDKTVSLDVDSSINIITLVNSTTDGTLYMTNNNTLGVAVSVSFGAGAGSGNGTIIQSDGALTAVNLIVGNVNAGSHTYTQSGGTVDVSLLRMDFGNNTALPCLYNLSGGSVTVNTFQNQDTDGNSYFNFTTGNDGTLTNGTLTVNSTDYDFSTFIDAGKIRQDGVTVTSADASWNVDTNVVGKTTLSVIIPEEVAVVFQENSVFPDLNVLASQLENNNVGSVRYTAASGGQNSGLGQSFEFGSATALRAITFQKGGSVTFPVSGTNELKLWIGEYDSSVTNVHTTGSTLYTQLFDVSGQAFTDGNFYTINLPSDLNLSAGVEYAFELAFSTLDATHLFNINRYYEGDGGTDTYTGGTIVYQQNIDGGVPFVSLLDEPENDLTFGLHSTVVPLFASASVNPTELDLLLTSPATTVTGAVDFAFNSDTNVAITVTISDESHPGSWSILSASPQTLTNSTMLEFELDQTVSNLVGGAVATGLVTIAWNEVGGAVTNEIIVPISATYASPGTFTRSGADTTWSGLAGWKDNSAGGGFIDSTRLPLGIDSVSLNNPVADLSVDIDATVGSMFVVNNANNATLNVDTAGKTLTVLGAMSIGSLTQSGTGTVNVTSGTLALQSNPTVNSKGLLDLNGGVVTIDQGPANIVVSGPGLVKLQSGTLTSLGTAASDVLTFTAPLEISGGTVDLNGQNKFEGGIKVIGDAASISAERFNQTNVGATPDYRFELGSNGVSTIDSFGFCHLKNSTITVDGSAYNGGSQTIDLFTSANIATLCPSVIITNFPEGVTAVFNQSTSENIAQLVITVAGYLGWASDYGVGASTANEDGDAANNLYEYGLGGDPTNSADTGMDSAFESGAGYIDYVHVRRVAATNEISYALALTDNLVVGTWTTNSGYTIEGYGPVVGDFDTVTNRIITTGKTAEFIDLVIEEL